MTLVINEGDLVWTQPSANIHGFQQCCSAAILHGISGYAQHVRKLPVKNEPPPELRIQDIAHVESLDEWRTRRAKKTPMFGFPKDYAMAWVLEKLYMKAKFGEGGHNMYASQSYATRTWFMADRKRLSDSLSCMNFMLWLKEQGVQKVGRIHISPYRDGAHGGYCKGAVYAPDLKKVRKFLDKKIDELNAYADYVFDMYGLTEENTGVGTTEAADEVADLW